MKTQLVIPQKKRRAKLKSDATVLVPLDQDYARLPLLIQRPIAEQLFNRGQKWFQRREATGELTPIKKNKGVVFYRREELLRAVGLIN